MKSYGNFNQTNAIFTTIQSLVKGQIAKELSSEPIPSECYILHNVAMASRRATQIWCDAVHAEKGRKPSFEELLVFLLEQANGRKSNVTEIWMEVMKLPFVKPTSSDEASAVVHSFISQAEALGLQSSEFGLVLSSLILPKMQDIITAEGLQKITTTVANYYSKVDSEQRPAAAAIASSGIFVWLSREVARFFDSKPTPSFMATGQFSGSATSNSTEKKVNRVQLTQPRATGAAKKVKESTSQSSATPADVPACSKMLLRCGCKWNSSRKYSHDAGVLAAARKFSVTDFLPELTRFLKKLGWI
jgi:hypothetical protein